MKTRRFLLLLALGCLLLGSCAQPARETQAIEKPDPAYLHPGATLAPAPYPAATAGPSAPGPQAYPAPTSTSTGAPAPLPTGLPDSGWHSLRPGLEKRTIDLLDGAGQRSERLTLLRLEPARFEFSVHAHPRPQTLEEWQAETEALVVINGGYFRQEGEDYLPTGLTVVDGKPSGSSYGDFAGMFAVGASGPELRWLARQPFDPSEVLQSALQSFPLLVKPGGELGFPAQYEDNQAARRSVIARDRVGRFLFIAAQQGIFTLHTLSQYLVDSDLELDIALNLDGGPSTGLLLADPLEVVHSFTALPVVITARSK